VQVLTENGHANFAVILFAAFKELCVLLADEEKLADCLDFRHLQKVKAQQPARLKLAEVKAALALD
jgi:hypothetical protein